MRVFRWSMTTRMTPASYSRLLLEFHDAVCQQLRRPSVLDCLHGTRRNISQNLSGKVVDQRASTTARTAGGDSGLPLLRSRRPGRQRRSRWREELCLLPKCDPHPAASPPPCRLRLGRTCIIVTFSCSSSTNTASPRRSSLRMKVLSSPPM